MRRRTRGRTAVVLIPAIILLALGGRASQAAGPVVSPAVRLRGDPDLVAVVKTTLAERGILTLDAGDEGGVGDGPDDSARGAVDVKLERRGARIVVSVDGGGGATGREVTDARTAATIIESQVRVDVEAPLLANRAIGPTAAPEPPFPPAAPEGAASSAASSAAPSAAAPTTAVSIEASRPGRGVQLFTLAETSRANDHTSWLGVQVGACLMLGPVCAGARARFAVVAEQPWQKDIDRRGVEVLLGADLPMRIGVLTISPGIGAGVGSTHTHEEGSGRSAETGGPHADLHVALSYPFGKRAALEAALSLDVTQTTHVETSSPTPLPDEPIVFGRLGAGLRFGAL